MCIGLHTLPPCLLFCGNYILHESEYDVHIFLCCLDIIIYPAPHSAPARMPGVYAQGLCTMQSQPSIHSLSRGKGGRGIGIINQKLISKTDFFSKLNLYISVCRKTNIFLKWGLGRSPKRGEGGSPTLSPARTPGVYAQRLCTMQSQQSIHSPSPRGRGLGFRQGCRDRTPKGFAGRKAHKAFLWG